MRGKRIFIDSAMVLSALVSLLCQTPELMPYEWLKFLKFFWLIPFGCLLYTHPRDFIDIRLRPFYIFFIGMALYSAAMQAISGKVYLGMDVYDFGLSAGIAAVSFAYWKNFSSWSVVRAISIGLCVIALILSILITSRCLVHLDFGDYLTGYEFKNALGFYLVLLMTFTFTLRKRFNRSERIFLIVSALVLTAFILLLRSRASYLCLATLAVLAFFDIKSGKTKTALLILAGCAAITVLAVPQINDFIITKLVMGNRSLSDPNLFSSFRLEAIVGAWRNLGNGWIFGNGEIYIDCFPVKIFFEYGIVGLAAVAAFLIHVGKRLDSGMKSRLELAKPATFLFAITLVNCIFEAYPPFGPGLRCMLLWMTFAFMLAEEGPKATRINLR